MNSDLKITLSRVLEKPLQINGTDTETHYINELFKRLVFHELLNKLNLKSLYHYRDNVKYCPGKVELNFTLNKQELDLLINQITSMDNVQKTYIILQPWLQDLNKGEQEELIQLLIKTMEEIFETLRKQIKGGFDQNNIIIILDNSNQKLFTMEDLNLLSEELLEQIFVYLIDINWEEDQIDEILDQIWGIEEELEQESQQLIKNLILSNQINQITPTQIKIQF